MKYIFLLVQLLIASVSLAQLKVCSWNIANLGKSKNEAEIAFIAATLQDYDVVALQEVLTGPGGAQAVSRLAAALNRSGGKWEYAISEPTSSYENKQQSERYAFLWKPSVVKLQGKPFLDQQFEKDIEREPFVASFLYQGKPVSLASFHALPRKKKPEEEIKYLSRFSLLKGKEPVIFLGDFNCPQSHPVFLSLKKSGYKNVLKGQKTTLKQECKENECLASEYDNIFFPVAKVNVAKSGVLPFHLSFKRDMRQARLISDHLPVFATINLN